MKAELQLKVQAYLDGELLAGEAREVADLIARDAEARSLHAELNHTRRALKTFESEVKLPESREFYWTKIQREIARSEKPRPLEAPVGFGVWLRRWLAPAGALTALLIAAIMTWQQLHTGFVMETETALADSDAFTYRDYSKGVTLVWLSYPAENEFTDLIPANTFEQ